MTFQNYLALVWIEELTALGAIIDVILVLPSKFFLRLTNLFQLNLKKDDRKSVLNQSRKLLQIFSFILVVAEKVGQNRAGRLLKSLNQLEGNLLGFSAVELRYPFWPEN